MTTPSTSADPDEEYRRMRWLYTEEEIKNSPSFAQDKLEPHHEVRYRYEGGKLIYQIGHKLHMFERSREI